MKRLIPALTVLPLIAMPAVSQAAGLYIEGFAGLTFLDDAEYDTDIIGGVDIDFDSKYKTGGNIGAALGTALPLAGVTLRLEGEIAYRGNEVDEVTDAEGDQFDAIDNSSISALSGMANAHIDVYMLPNLAVSGGAGLGYARLNADIAIDNLGNDLSLIDDETDNVFAYQLMAGVRYDLGPSTISLGYRYFVADDPKFEVDGSGGANDYEAEYTAHNVNIGLAYNF